MSERWLPVVGYEGLYEVSDYGRVRSVKGGKQRLLKILHYKKNYPVVGLSKDGMQKPIPVHRLVLFAFVGPPPEGMEARHFPDRDKANCRLSNLSWSTHAINNHDKVLHGTSNIGERNGSAKLTADMVREIQMIKEWPRGLLARIAREYDVSVALIQKIRDRKIWKHLEEK